MVRVEMPATGAALRIAPDNFAAEQRTAFDLARGGLLRATLIETGVREYGFLLRASRMVADDTALAILCEELGALYGAARLPEPGRTYSDFAAWHGSRLTEARVAQELTYWADPARSRPQEINHHFGGRGVYFEDPDGHLLEVITRPYGSEGQAGANNS